MKTERQNCFCFNIALEGNIVDEDILELLKFLIVNVDTGALENSTVCDDCLNKIVESCEYKTKNSSKMLLGIKKEIRPEEPVICQKCKTVCEQRDNFPLVDCVTQIDWSDFVNYLFLDQYLQSLESSQICGSCRISVSNIQQFLKLLYVYDRNKMKCDIDYCDDIKATGNENLAEIKQEFENYVTDDKREIESILEDNKTEVGDSDYISYADFKCTNDELDLKLEYDHQSTDRYENVHVKGIIVSGGSNINSTIKENEQSEQEIDSEECSRLGCNTRVCKDIPEFQSNYSLHLNNHVLKNHQCRDGSTKIHKCDDCNYETTNKRNLSRHKLKHKRTAGLGKYKCKYCIYETYDISTFIEHVKIHNKDFKCTLCSNSFAQKIDLDEHLLKIHKSRDSVTSKIYECDKCSYFTTYISYFQNHIREHPGFFKCTLCSKYYTRKRNLSNHLLTVHKSKYNITNKIHECDKCNYETTIKGNLLRHKLKHEKVAGFDKYKCQHCIYETYDKSNLIRHMKIHILHL